MSNSPNEGAPVQAEPANPAVIHNLPESLRNQGYELVVRSTKGCFGLRNSPAWGRRLVPVADPISIDLDPADFDRLELPAGFPRIPAEIWSRVVLLYFYFCNPNNKTVDSTTEVSVRFTRKRSDPSIWRCWVPKQEVGGGTVHARFDQGMVDIVTGEMLEGATWPPEDEYDAGSSHSHNTMSSFFSTTDDSNELGCPGIHIVVGNIDRTNNKYTMLSSIVLDKKRFLVNSPDVVDRVPLNGTKFHEKVLEVVTKYTYKSTYSGTSYPGYSYKKDAPKEVVVYDATGARIGVRTSDLSRVNEPYSKNASETPTVDMPKAVEAATTTTEQTPTPTNGSTISSRDIIVSKMSQVTTSGQLRAAGKRVLILLKRMFKSPEGKMIAEGAIQDALKAESATK